MMDNRRYIIFDLDGTLVDSFATVVRACGRVIAAVRPEAVPSEACFSAHRGQDMEQLFDEQARLAGLEPAAFREAYDEAYAADCLAGTTILEPQYKVLQAARAEGLGIIVLTNKRQQLAEQVCRHFFGSAVDIIIGRRDAVPIKATKAVVERFRELGINPAEQCARYYGDSKTDERTAAELNVDYINVNK